MIPMINRTDVVKTVRRGPKFYQAAPGQQIDVYRIDVGFMLTAGFRRAEADEVEADPVTPDPVQPDAEVSPVPANVSMNLRELKSLAAEAGIDGFPTMNKADLVSALTNTTRSS
jgi:hypothetical protein